MAKESSHGHFVLLLRVTGVKEAKIDALAKEIHDAYMKEYGNAGAVTVALLRLLGLVDPGTNATQTLRWEYVVRYFGPTASVAWLQQRLEAVAKEAGGKAETQTYRVTDITGRY